MYNTYGTYPYPYYTNTPRYNSDNLYNSFNAYQCPYYVNASRYDSDFSNQYGDQYPPLSNEMDYTSGYGFMNHPEYTPLPPLKDYGPAPFVININEAAKQNDTFRTALWTGKHLQVTLMSINVGDDIGLEIHPNIDQFIRIEEGQGLVKMGKDKDNLDFQANAYDDFAIMIPAGTWHNVINTGDVPLKVYSIYAPPQHPFGTVHVTKADAETGEQSHRYQY